MSVATIVSGVAMVGTKHAGRLAAAAAVLLSMAIPAPALGAEAVTMQSLLNADGSGRLFVNDVPSPSGGWAWEACSEDLSACTPFATGADINTGAAAPGTVFRVSGGGVAGSSPVWHGNLSVVAPPSVNGVIRANELVTPELATWSGGWDRDFDQTQLAACTTIDGQDCLSITEPKYVDGCPKGAAVLDPSLAGRYLRIADRRVGAGSAFTMEAATTPYGHEIWPANGSTAVAMVGPILPAAGLRVAACGPPPLRPEEAGQAPTEPRTSGGSARLRCAHACRQVQVVVDCEGDCRVILSARRGDVHVRKTRRPYRYDPSGSHQPVTLRLGHRRLRQLGTGRAAIDVYIDAMKVASRKIWIP